MISQFVFLQAAVNPGTVNLFFIAAMFLVVYFFFLRPQMKKQKAQQQFLNELQKGDSVVTGSGLIGKISKINKHSISLQLDQKVFIDVLPNAISHEMTIQYQKDSSTAE